MTSLRHYDHLTIIKFHVLQLIKTAPACSGYLHVIIVAELKFHLSSMTCQDWHDLLRSFVVVLQKA